MPEALTRRMRTEQATREWVSAVPSMAAELAQQWSLRPDGAVMSGALSVVWPVRDAAGRAQVLKIGYPDEATPAEVLALRAWAGRGIVRCWDHDAGRNALLLQRLDPGRTLQEEPDADRAWAWAAGVLARLHETPVRSVPGVRDIAADARRMAHGIRDRREAASRWLPAPAVSAALATLGDMSAQTWGQGHGRLVHYDCHFLNVLHTSAGDGEPDAWCAIDPLPVIGPVEAEAVPLLRNRWSDTAATGDPDRALRYRVDQVMDAVSGDAGLARDWAQAVAVDNLTWHLTHEPDHMFVPPYSVMANWY